MPILISKTHPAFRIYEDNQVYTMDPDIARRQDIRALRIGILNLMPGVDKKETDLQIAGLLGNTSLQIELLHLYPDSKPPTLPDDHHLRSDYKPFSREKRYGFDGLIITGAPFGKVPYEKISYWDELRKIMDWACANVTSTLLYCWAAHAGLKHFYGIERHLLDEPLFGILEYHVNRESNSLLVKNLDDVFPVPQSRLNGIERADVIKHHGLQILIESDRNGLHLISTTDHRLVFMQGHPEYPVERLRYEYERNCDIWKKNGCKGTEPLPPKNYSLDNPHLTWRANGQAFFDNWRNLVYQGTKYRLIPRTRKLIYRMQDRLNHGSLPAGVGIGVQSGNMVEAD